LNTRTIAVFFFVPLASVAFPACSSESAKASSATAAASAPTTRPEGSPAPLATAHEAMPPSAAVASVSGTVLETMDAATYTYVKVKGDAGDIWAASTRFDVKVGDRVTVPLESPMENFHSQSLNRDFPLIYFASRISREGEAAAGQMPPGHPPVATAPGQMPPGHPPAAAAPVISEKIAPPAGGRSIASVWADRASLAGKSVVVRGQVVKFNGGIMGRNWIHIQDGSGAAADKTNDLTVTTADSAKVGDTVTVSGTVAVDKDFGAGYSYAVIVENAKVEPK
jgi:hypothetical protein